SGCSIEQPTTTYHPAVVPATICPAYRAICTVPDPSPRPSALHDFSSSTTRHGDQVTSIHTHIISSTEFSIMSAVVRRETLNPDTDTESMIS
ncbi:unnamed protein product, partial [Ascophyllum nodosum]